MTYAEIPCETAEHFLAHLIQWRTSDPSWYEDGIYRGVGDASHQLVPSAFRPDGAERLRRIAAIEAKPGQDIPATDNSWRQIFNEVQAVGHFYRFANQQGIELPQIPPGVHHSLLRRKNDLDFHGNLMDVKLPWPPPDLWATLALAQHYGIPTRLLDWSSDPLIATYFAASRAISRIENNSNGEGCLAVWHSSAAILARTVSLCRHPWLHHRAPLDETFGKTAVYVIDAPNAWNPNLAAQRGRFTLVIDEKPWSGVVNAAPLDQTVGGIVDLARTDNTAMAMLLPGIDRTNSQFVLFEKLTLPWRQSPQLLRSLHRLGYHAARLFPGLGGCEQAVAEMERLVKLSK